MNRIRTFIEEKIYPRHHRNENALVRTHHLPWMEKDEETIARIEAVRKAQLDPQDFISTPKNQRV